jgi:anti-sigma regulatory factor (Ser/Thr protein kinase)
MSTVRQTISSDAADLNPLFDMVDRFCVMQNLSEDVSGNLKIIVDELASNVIKYVAGICDIEIILSKHDDHIEFTFRDTGPEFNPLSLDDPDLDNPVSEREIGGLGLMMVKALTHEQRYERINNHNIVVLSCPLT